MSQQEAGTGVLDLDAIIADARAATGLSEFGEFDGFQDRASRWLAAAAREGGLGEVGLGALRQLVTGFLVDRLRFAEDLRRHPEILEQPVERPIIVTGMPRTGTTKVQRSLATAPGNQGLPFWRILQLAPSPDAVPGQPDPRIATAAGYLDLIKQFNPEFLVGHPLGVIEPEEEGFLVEADFQSLCNCFRVRVPSYFNQIIDSPGFESYPYLKRCLQYVQWQRDGAAEPWVLKTVSHIGLLPRLLETFPDATVVHCYRDPVVAVGSICKILELFRSLLQPDMDLHAHGAELLGLWSDMQRRHLEARKDPAIDARVVDARFDDICTDIGGVARTIYERAGRELDDEAYRHIVSWEENNPQHGGGKFQYSLERYGLTADQVRDVFAEYIARFERVPA